jgi:hypothetical protein
MLALVLLAAFTAGVRVDDIPDANVSDVGFERQKPVESRSYHDGGVPVLPDTFHDHVAAVVQGHIIRLTKEQDEHEHREYVAATATNASIADADAKIQNIKAASQKHSEGAQETVDSVHAKVAADEAEATENIRVFDHDNLKKGVNSCKKSDKEIAQINQAASHMVFMANAGVAEGIASNIKDEDAARVKAEEAENKSAVEVASAEATAVTMTKAAADGAEAAVDAARNVASQTIAEADKIADEKMYDKDAETSHQIREFATLTENAVAQVNKKAEDRIDTAEKQAAEDIRVLQQKEEDEMSSLSRMQASAEKKIEMLGTAVADMSGDAKSHENKVVARVEAFTKEIVANTQVDAAKSAQGV